MSVADNESVKGKDKKSKNPLDIETDISWNPALEQLIAEEAERCSGSSWLHNECERYFSRLTNFIALPVIILSTANGFLSGSSQLIFPDAKVSSIGIGVASLFTGILSTIGSYFAWAKRTEAHKISSIQYQKIARFLTIELSLPKKERIQAKDILKITRDQIERLMEISPAIPDSILKRYKERFNNIDGVTHPDVISGLHKVFINKYEDAKVADTSNVSLVVKPEFVLPSYSLGLPKGYYQAQSSPGTSVSSRTNGKK